MAETNIASLPELIKRLPGADRAIIERLYLVSAGVGQLEVPATMRAFAESHFGAVANVQQQTIVKVTNRVTLETTMFNPIRAMRPHAPIEGDLEQLINAEQGDGKDVFHKPLEETAKDVFGRVQGEFSVTAANVAKADVWHGVVVFNEFHPHKFSQEQVIDYLMTAREWAEMVVQQDPQARYFMFVWNALWRAGGSVMHGHAQMTVGRDMHYGIIERLRRDAENYQLRHRRSYFTDLVNAHRALGLTADPADRVKALVSLTPAREREIMLLTDDYSAELGEAIYKTLSFYKSVGVASFNVLVQMPPIVPTNENWQDFPVLVRLVDRGNPLRRQSDIGAPELFAASIVSQDPFKTASGFREWLRQNKG